MRFEAFRELKNWTLEDAADAMRVPADPRLAGINAAMISRHERGSAFPNPEFIARYAEITEDAVTFADWLAVREQARQEPGNVLPERKRGRRPREAAPL